MDKHDDSWKDGVRTKALDSACNAAAFSMLRRLQAADGTQLCLIGHFWSGFSVCQSHASFGN